MTVDATREKIIKFITNSKQSSISVDIYNNEQYNDAPIVIAEPSYVPEGYYVKSYNVTNHPLYSFILCKAKKGGDSYEKDNNSICQYIILDCKET